MMLCQARCYGVRTVSEVVAVEAVSWHGEVALLEPLGCHLPRDQPYRRASECSLAMSGIQILSWKKQSLQEMEIATSLLCATTRTHRVASLAFFLLSLHGALFRILN